MSANVTTDQGAVEVNLQQAALAVAAAGRTPMRAAYLRAVVEGSANTQCTADQERGYGTLRLLTLATLRLPDLTLYAHWAHVCDDVSDGQARRVSLAVLRAVADVACGALRLAHRALETHCDERDDDAAGWVTRAIDRASEQLRAQPDRQVGPYEVGVTLGLVRLAMVSLARATAATADDPELVSDELSYGLGDLFAVYLIARQAGRS
ncbi:MAG TPA: hypothetical protein VG106_06625 [Vicinamibacterales bacterium]|nr:hypothetical protein [Vicinamibacterales bacterium]